MIANVVAEYTPGDVAGGVGPRRARRRDGGALRHGRHRRGAARARPRGDRRGVPRRRARRLRASARRRSRGSSEGLMRDLERYMVLQVVDIRWREHLENMDYMREGIHLRGMAQKDPLVEYRNEGHIDVPRAEPRDPRRGDRAALPRAGRGRRPDGDGQRRRAAGPLPARGPNGGRTAISPTSTRRSPAPTRSPRRAARTATAASPAATGGSVATQAGRQVRAGEHRPQRPVLVRLGQEVQALPRR